MRLCWDLICQLLDLSSITAGVIWWKSVVNRPNRLKYYIMKTWKPNCRFLLTTVLRVVFYYSNDCMSLAFRFFHEQCFICSTKWLFGCLFFSSSYHIGSNCKWRFSVLAVNNLRNSWFVSVNFLWSLVNESTLCITICEMSNIFCASLCAPGSLLKLHIWWIFKGTRIDFPAMILMLILKQALTFECYTLYKGV